MSGNEKPHLSPSGLGMLERCGEQYRRRYIEGEKIPPGIQMIVGTGTHGAAAFELNAKVTNDGVLPSLVEVHDAARSEFQKGYEREGVLWSAEEQEQGVERVLGAKIDETIGLATAYHQHYAPVLEPIPGRVEWFWRIPTDYSHDLTGIIDVETETAGDGRVVRDLKTSGKTPPQNEADMSEQLTFYAMAVQATDGALPDALALDYLVSLKGGVKAVTLTTYRDEASITVMGNRIHRALDVINAGAFTPARPNEWFCSRTWCGYWTSCRFAVRPVSVPV